MQWKLEQHTYTIRDQLLQLGIKDTTYQLLVKSLHFPLIRIIFVMDLDKTLCVEKLFTFRSKLRLYKETGIALRW